MNEEIIYNFPYIEKTLNITKEFAYEVKLNKNNTNKNLKIRICTFFICYIYAHLESVLTLLKSNITFKNTIILLHLRPVLEAYINFRLIFTTKNKNELINLFANFEVINKYMIIREYNLTNKPKYKNLVEEYKNLEKFYENLENKYKGIKKYVYEKGKNWINLSFKEKLNKIEKTKRSKRGFMGVYKITSNIIHASSPTAEVLLEKNYLIKNIYEYDIIFSMKLLDILEYTIENKIYKISDELKLKIYKLSNELTEKLDKLD